MIFPEANDAESVLGAIVHNEYLERQTFLHSIIHR